MWGMLNSKQIPTQTNAGFADITIPPRLALGTAQIAANTVVFGFPRVAGCYPFRAFALMNEAVDPTIAVTLMADQSDTVCAVRISSFAQVAEVGSKLGAQIYWKTGANPLGVQTTVEGVERGNEIA